MAPPMAPPMVAPMVAPTVAPMVAPMMGPPMGPPATTSISIAKGTEGSWQPPIFFWGKKWGGGGFAAEGGRSFFFGGYKGARAKGYNGAWKAATKGLQSAYNTGRIQRNLTKHAARGNTKGQSGAWGELYRVALQIEGV
jgi:hypothetical protein